MKLAISLRTFMTWQDEEIQRRREGVNRPLYQSQHDEINSIVPGLTWEYCCECGEPTGRAGRADDSLFIDDDGPYCLPCYEDRHPA